MNSSQIEIKISRKPIWIGIVVLSSLIIIFIFASWILYTHTVDLLTGNLRERLLAISITAAANIDAKDLDALQVEEDWKKPEWARVVNVLHKAKYSNKDIVYMYIIRKTKNDSSQMEFVADAGSINPYANTENNPSGAVVAVSSCPKCVDANDDGEIDPEGADYLQWPGQPNPDPADHIPEAFEAYNDPITVKDIYTDEYGSVLTGFAPIKDENGNTVAVLATDIKADDFFTVTRQTLYPFLIFIALLTLVILIFNILLIRSIKKEVEQREEMAKMAEDVKRAYVIEKRAKEEIEKLDKFKDQFLMITQHNLRTPLTSMMGYADLLLKGVFGKQTKKTTEVIEKFQSLTQGMIKMVNEFLDMTQFQLGKNVVNLKPGVDITQILEDIKNELDFKAHSKGVYLKFEKSEKPLFIKADREKLKAAIFNIIDNAVKYTVTGGVDVKVKGQDNVKIIVTDTGIGIPKEKISNIFDSMFERGEEAKKTSTVGSGIGLYLSGQIIKSHNGKVWAESNGQGKGSVFYIELPLSAQ